MGHLPKGGSFVCSEAKPEDVFIREQFNDEQKMIFRSTLDFVNNEVLSRMDEIEEKNEDVILGLLRQLGDLGLIGTGVPEEYGGSDLDKISYTICAENMGRTGSFFVLYAGVTGIGTLPLAYFGNAAQKNGILPDLVSGEKICAYALTEPGAGSDAMALKTNAVLSTDGKRYIINGSKQFISNAAIANFFTVFAKVDGKITAFLIDKDSVGLSMGPEEHKLGLKGSSTRCLFLENVEVPVENVLFEVGSGHIVAFNLLNLGRLSCGAGSLSMAKYALEEAANHANNRKQFGMPITSFGLIQEKLAEMAIRIFAAESILYRTAGLIDGVFSSIDKTSDGMGKEIAVKLPEYAIECSINKVVCSEIASYVIDEAVQIHGGYGFIADYPVERLYRDVRATRIFEGTNEINRILISTHLLRSLKKGLLPINEKINELRADIKKREMIVRESEGEFVTAAKETFLFTLGLAVEKTGDGLTNNQQILGRLADLAMEVFLMESVWIRGRKVREIESENKVRIKSMMVKAYLSGAMPELEKRATEVIAAICGKEDVVENTNVIKGILTHVPQNVIALRTEIAEAVSCEGKYPG